MSRTDALRGSFVTVEGVIGVGKSTVTSLLATALDAETMYEIVEENPFLKDFYRDRNAWALQTETFFLLNRLKQLEDVERMLMAGRSVVADYNLFKNRIFASLTLAGRKHDKYVQIYDTIAADLPRADLILYLTADTDTIMRRIRHRDRPFERNMDRGYIESLSRVYEQTLGNLHEAERVLHGAQILQVDTSDLDFAASPQDRAYLIDLVRSTLASIRNTRRAG